MGASGALGEVAGAAVKEAAPIAKGLLRDEITPWFRSFASELKKTKAGTLAHDYIQNEFEPAVAKMATEHHAAAKIHNPKASPIESRKEAQKYLRQKYFLKGDSVIQGVIAAAAKERGLIHANTLADGFSVYFHGQIDHRLQTAKGVLLPNFRDSLRSSGVEVSPNNPYYNPSELEKKTRDAMSWMFTPRIAIPHLSQPVNFLMAAPIKSVAKGVSDFIFSDAKQIEKRVIQSGALHDEIIHQFTEEAKGGGWFNQKFRKVFHQPFFNELRKKQIIMAASVGKHTAQDLAQDLIENGPTEKNINYFKMLGIGEHEFFTIIDNKGLTDEMIDKAMYRFAHETMFIRSPLETPSPWERNAITRFATMYKQFPYREGKFIVDSIHRSYKAEGTKGVLKTLAIMGTMFPAAGEAVKIAENLVTGHDAYKSDDPDKIMNNEYLDAIGHTAGFGIAYSMVRSAQRRGLTKFLMGPLFSSGVDIVTDGFSNDPVKNVSRDLVKRAGLPGPYLAKKFIPTQKQAADEKRGDKPIKHKVMKKKNKNNWTRNLF